jgi:hypothetical protein
MRRIIFLSLAMLITSGVMLAEDFWTKKEFMQWSDDEVKKILTNSPWAKDIFISVPRSVLFARGQRPAESSTTDVETGGGGGGRGRGRGGGGGGAAGGGDAPTESMIVLNISWRTAVPMRQALVRSRLSAGAAVPAEAQQMISKNEDTYVIVVSGVPAGLARTIQNGSALEKTVLRAGKKDPIAAKDMNIQQRAQTVDLIYAFPRAAAITADDKEVEVVLKLGQVEAKKKFNLKDMLYNGKLEL